MKKQTFNLMINNVSCYFPAYNYFQSWDMTKKDMENYIQQLKKEIESLTYIPDNSCLYNFEAHFVEHHNADVFLTNTFNNRTRFKKGSDIYLCVDFWLKNSCKCFTQNCLKNIQNGECHDKTVIKLIGKKLFKDKYTKGK